MDKSVNWSIDIDCLLSKSGLSTINKEVLKNSIKAYKGDMSQHLKLLSYSELSQKSKIATNFFSKFIWSFEKD